MSEEIKIPAGVDKSIADFLTNQNYQNRMCIRNVNTLADTLAQNTETITSEVFFDILSRLDKRDISQLPDIYAVRNAVTALLQGSNIATVAPAAAPAAAPKNEPVLAFAGTVPAESTELNIFDRPAAEVPEGAPTPKRLGGVSKNPVMSTVADLAKEDPFTTASEALEAAPAEIKTELETLVEDVISELPFDMEESAAEQVIEAQFSVEDTFTPEQKLISEAVQRAATVEDTAQAEPVSSAAEKSKAEEAPTGRKSRKVSAAADPDEVIKKLLAVIDERDARIKQLEKSLAEAAESTQLKLSRSTADRLAELGITV